MAEILMKAAAFVAIIFMGYLLRKKGFFKEEDFQREEKIKKMKAHLAVADTIKRLTSAVKRMKRINIHKLLKEAEDSRLAPKMAMHLSKWEYSKQANICEAKKAITK